MYVRPRRPFCVAFVFSQRNRRAKFFHNKILRTPSRIGVDFSGFSAAKCNGIKILISKSFLFKYLEIATFVNC
jgi:hypothetical protein